MNRYSLIHVPDPVLLRDLRTLVAQECSTTAQLLAHLAEVDARKLYLPTAYPSMFAYCVGELHLSEDAAYKRIQAARAARQFPEVFTAVAEGQLHLTGVGLLAPHLTEANAHELLEAAAGKTKAEIEQLLAERVPRPELLDWVQPLGAPSAAQLAPAQVGPPENATNAQLAPVQVEGPGPSAPGRMEKPSRVVPVTAERYALQLTVSQGTHDKLRYAQELLGHAVPSGEIAEVLDRALDVLIRQLERRKFAATEKPRPRPRNTSRNPRHIPAAIKRAVWQRDGGRCTFVSESGHRCTARTRLEFDHLDEVARGGRATVAGLRLRCRAHNQYAAERTFGTGFMERKRAEAAAARAQKAAERVRNAAEAERAQAAATARAQAAAEVIPWLRQLGCRADEARWAATACESIPEAPLEQRLKAALASLSRGRRAG